MVNILKYFLSSSYRKHRWARKHLPLYRAFPILLSIHRVQRQPLILGRLVEMQYQDNMNKVMGKLIHIPKYSDVSAKELEDGRDRTGMSPLA